jgi:V/A-type H+/Na+-transporting ATPase subunit E
MTQEQQVQSLEASLLARATALAQEQVRNAEAAREHIRAQSREKLQAMEERAVAAARLAAEKQWQRSVQAAQLRLQADLDRLRWNLVQAVLTQAKERFAAALCGQDDYRRWVQERLAPAGGAFPEGALVVRVSAADEKRLGPHWAQLCARALPGRKATLASEDGLGGGGFVVESEDRRVRLDQTLEGRVQRLEPELHRAIMERLFASIPDMGALLHG